MSYYRLELPFGEFYICVLPGKKIWPVADQICRENNAPYVEKWLAHPLFKGEIPRDATIHCRPE